MGTSSIPRFWYASIYTYDINVFWMGSFLLTGVCPNMTVSNLTTMVKGAGFTVGVTNMTISWNGTNSTFTITATVDYTNANMMFFLRPIM